MIETIRANATLCDELHRSIGGGPPPLPNVPRVEPACPVYPQAVDPSALGARVRAVARARRAGDPEVLRQALQGLAQLALAWAGQLASGRERHLTSRTAA